MKTSPLTELYERWTRPSYEIRVRGTSPTFLWGSGGITENISFDKPLILHIRNDPFGEPIAIGTQVASGTQTALGSLQPGEFISLPVQSISGVFATCALESVAACIITATR